MSSIKRIDISKLPKRVSQPYELTSQFDFNIHESRILIRVLQYIKRNQIINAATQIDLNNNVLMRFRPKDLTVSNDYKLVFDALRSIRRKEIIVDMKSNENGEIANIKRITGLFVEVDYDENNSFVDIKMNADWYMFLVDLSRGFTSYLSNVGFLSSNVKFLNIYQWISHWFKKGSIEGIELNEKQIRNNFKIDKYSDLRKIIKYVIEPAKKELDKVADKSFNYTLNRLVSGAIRGKGAKIISISFKFYETNNFKEKKTSTYNAKRAARTIDSFIKIYGLSNLDEQKLGALAKTYDLALLSTIEYDNREYLQKSDNFLETFHKLLMRKVSKKIA